MRCFNCVLYDQKELRFAKMRYRAFQAEETGGVKP
jgi:hypothetical protein